MPHATAPVDLKTMRETASLLLAPDADRPAPEELEKLFLMLSGMIHVAVPEVETAAGRLSKDDVPRACALACIGEARMRLRLPSGETFEQQMSLTTKLARSVRALADHCQALGCAS
ncbi:DUF6415 family natural product biosynthesis protein [Streptomyces sp. AC512_CC834]|uniref:DUF6415 family natural product biosynthesis protein n=1 Tax=Streptomyces sp. AC512_CC834 TaxID=2823691 RepID=UPI001C25F6D1|nr:DUF6415 family natural product biosynthesis protein [Streptomyces sp. AC512_CC834]